MTSETRYTMGEAAGRVGVREDDLPALLQNVGIDLTAAGHPDTLSGDELAKLAAFVARVKDCDSKTPEAGVDA